MNKLLANDEAPGIHIPQTTRNFAGRSPGRPLATCDGGFLLHGTALLDRGVVLTSKIQEV